MIYALIALSIAGVVIAALAVIVYIVIRRNSRLLIATSAALRDAEELRDAALLGKAALSENVSLATMLKAEIDAHKKMQLRYEILLKEHEILHKKHNELEARSTVLEEELAAKPTMPTKRAPKNSTQAPRQAGRG